MPIVTGLVVLLSLGLYLPGSEVEGIALFCVTLQCNHLPAVFTLVFVSTKSIVGYLAGGSFVVSEMLLRC